MAFYKCNQTEFYSFHFDEILSQKLFSILAFDIIDTLSSGSFSYTGTKVDLALYNILIPIYFFLNRIAPSFEIHPCTSVNCKDEKSYRFHNSSQEMEKTECK